MNWDYIITKVARFQEKRLINSSQFYRKKKLIICKSLKLLTQKKLSNLDINLYKYSYKYNKNF